MDLFPKSAVYKIHDPISRRIGNNKRNKYLYCNCQAISWAQRKIDKVNVAEEKIDKNRNSIYCR